MHRDLVNSQAHMEFSQISVFAEDHRRTQSRRNKKTCLIIRKNNQKLACNISAYACARKIWKNY
jgi:hypothetical protein